MLKLSYKIDKLINKCNYNTKAIKLYCKHII